MSSNVTPTAVARDSAPTPPPAPAGAGDKPVSRLGDQIFQGLATGSGAGILVVLAMVAGFLLFQGVPAMVAAPDDLQYGAFWPWVLPLVFGTVWAALLALLMAVPVAIGIALFITHYAPRRLAAGLGYVIDLLAAVPSVVFGLWGVNVLAPLMRPLYDSLTGTLGFIPFFAGPASGTGRTVFTVAIILAVMVLPIITALSRELFLQTPRLHEEAALALGATRWEVIKMAVIPYARPGLISATMLGLGRALGETMAVAMVLSGAGLITFKLLSSENPSTIAGNIALAFPEAFGLGVNQLIASGLVLFVITLGVNMIARWIVSRRAAFSGAN